MRIVSLIPSATEIVCALGFEKDLVGRSHECDFPSTVTRLPICTEPKFNPEGTSYEIDQRVKAILQEALSVYRVDGDLLRSLKPDVIVTQSQCEVCAVNMAEVESVVAQWLGEKPRLVSLSPCSLDDVFDDFLRVARALDASARGDELVRETQSRMAAVKDKAAKLSVRPSVACIEWIDPLMAAGNWMPELVTMAGGKNLFGTAGQHSPWMKFDDLVERDPDVVLLSPCGFTIDRALQDLPELKADPRWDALKAVRERRVYAADGSQFFNRPGPRLADSLEILAELIHPNAFKFGHSGWRQL
jgi:iron complex transport system substrate-binding protein